MYIDVRGAFGDPEIRQIIAKRDEVIGHFGPLFRDPSRLSREDYCQFLSLKYNHHWSGLERRGRRAAEDIDNLRGAISILVDQSADLAERFDFALEMLRGVGVATLSPILLVAYPDRYGVWNSSSEAALRSIGQFPEFERGASTGEKYQKINMTLLRLADEYCIDLWGLDALWWFKRPDTERVARTSGYKKDGHVKDALFRAAWEMAAQAEQTANQSNGQTVERIVKNKELRIPREEMIKLLVKSLEENNRCALTGLELDLSGTDKQLKPSLDRIDSDGHYEEGNIQVVARFANFWKSDMDDGEFRRLLQLVRAGRTTPAPPLR